MPGVSFGLADFVTGGPILDLPVMEGASWGAQLNRPDSVSCTIDMRDPDALALDLRSSSEPNKTIIFARTDSDVILAWGLIGDDGREWDEDAKTLTLSAAGIGSSWLGSCIIAPVAALTAPLITNDAEGFPQVNPALNTTIAGYSHGTIGKKLVEQRLAWPGSPSAVFDLPPDEIGTRSQAWLFSSMKRIGSALDDLTKQEAGPDFAFDAARDSSGLGLRYVMRHGSEANPRIGTAAGIWSLGNDSPLIGFKATDAIAAGASAAWMTAGKQAGATLISRARNAAMIAAGYPPMDIVDTSHSDVAVQATLDRYNGVNLANGATLTRDFTFSVRGDATPGLGGYRPGDTIKIDVPDGHPWLLPGQELAIRITSISGDETGKVVKIGCVIANA
jgi:hypothetical protein